MFTYRLDPSGPSRVGVAFTDRLGGVSEGPFASLNLSNGGPDVPGNGRANLGLVRAALGLEALVGLNQVHGAEVVRVGRGDLAAWDRAGASPDLPDVDGVITTEPGVGLCIRVADCVPVLFADASGAVIGGAHAGRKGLLAGVLAATVAAMRAALARFGETTFP